MTKHLYLTLLLGVPLVCAALMSSIVYAWNSFTVDPAPVSADGAGVETKDGYTIQTVRIGDTDYLVVSCYAPYANEKKEELKHVPRHFVTIYELVRKSEGKAELLLVGSRCIEWDRGYELINFKVDGSAPSKLRNNRD
jgi:hypothetical protein